MKVKTHTQKSDNIVAENFRTRWVNFIHDLQDEICSALENEDGLARFREDKWERGGGGGGMTRVLADGALFEKGGVNTSVVYGDVSDAMKSQLKIDGQSWFACGLSLVIHPVNPYVPTVHANWRYFELYNDDGNIVDRWFGGGSDLTPYYFFEEDTIHFHRTLRQAIDPFGKHLYPEYKKNCDKYFSNAHRNNETRGLGGVFYDYLRPTDEQDAERLFNFQKANGQAFLPAYLPIAKRRRNVPFSARETNWQELRRGRYVEFNLIHDRGTLFGLRTNGRTESILMSLPPRARWAYDYQPPEDSPEYTLLQLCLHPRDWV